MEGVRRKAQIPWSDQQRPPPAGGAELAADLERKGTRQILGRFSKVSSEVIAHTLYVARAHFQSTFPVCIPNSNAGQ